MLLVNQYSFIKYLNRYRIGRAQELLAKNDQSIADISQDTGFCDQSYFGAVFRKLVGIPPAAYRRRYHKQHIIEEQRGDQIRAASALTLPGLRRPPAQRRAASTRRASGSPSHALTSPELLSAEHVPYSTCAEDAMGFTAGTRLQGCPIHGIYGIPTNNNCNLLEPSGRIG